MAYSMTNARLRSSASIRAHLLRDPTRGRRFRRGFTLAGDSRQDCDGHRAPTQHATPGARPLGCALDLDGAYPVAQLRQHLGGGSKLGRDGQRQLERIGHRAVGPEEVHRARRAQGSPGQQRRQAVAFNAREK
jgi:hypothetical protein